MTFKKRKLSFQLRQNQIRERLVNSYSVSTSQNCSFFEGSQMESSPELSPNLSSDGLIKEKSCRLGSVQVLAGEGRIQYNWALSKIDFTSYQHMD